MQGLKDILLFQVNRHFISNAKNSLSIFEDLIIEGHQFSPEKLKQIRKKILDSSNDSIRDIEKNFEKVEIELKPEI
jgi:hypothetical protein